MGESDAATFVSDLAPSVPGFDCWYARATLRLPVFVLDWGSPLCTTANSLAQLRTSLILQTACLYVIIIFSCLLLHTHDS